MIGITMGDPGGIGPEVVVKALNDPALRERAGFVILGLGSSLHRAAGAAGIKPFWRSVGPGEPYGVAPGVVLIDDELGTGAANDPLLAHAQPFAPEDSALGGQLSLAWVEQAIKMAKPKWAGGARLDAIVTAPISKRSWALSGEYKFAGHTGLIAARFGAMKYAMMFVSPVLNVILVTDHMPLKHMVHAITPETVRATIELGHEACKRLGIAMPRIAVCGLNPHAGEHGVIGDEDGRFIQPGIEQAHARGIDASGPFPGDTIFRRALRGPGRTPEFDLVVAMYHDQGLIPVKLLAWDRAVNVTVGLPITRTSPDHGTAFDIAGQNKANPGSMVAAIELAIRMVQTDLSGV